MIGLTKIAWIDTISNDMRINSSDNPQFNNLISDNSTEVTMQILYDAVELKSNDDNNGSIIDDQENLIIDHVHAFNGTINDLTSMISVSIEIKFISTYNYDPKVLMYLLDFVIDHIISQLSGNVIYTNLAYLIHLQTYNMLVLINIYGLIYDNKRYNMIEFKKYKGIKDDKEFFENEFIVINSDGDKRMFKIVWKSVCIIITNLDAVVLTHVKDNNPTGLMISIIINLSNILISDGHNNLMTNVIHGQAELVIDCRIAFERIIDGVASVFSVLIEIIEASVEFKLINDTYTYYCDSSFMIYLLEFVIDTNISVLQERVVYTDSTYSLDEKVGKLVVDIFGSVVNISIYSNQNTSVSETNGQVIIDTILTIQQLLISDSIRGESYILKMDSLKVEVNQIVSNDYQNMCANDILTLLNGDIKQQRELVLNISGSSGDTKKVFLDCTIMITKERKIVFVKIIPLERVHQNQVHWMIVTIIQNFQKYQVKILISAIFH